MVYERANPSRLSGIVLPAILASILLLFGFHAVQGRHGLLALRQYEDRIATLAVQERALAARRADLQAHVDLLDLGAVDPDYLDELVRRGLGYAAPGDLIVRLPD